MWYGFCHSDRSGRVLPRLAYEQRHQWIVKPENAVLSNMDPPWGTETIEWKLKSYISNNTAAVKHILLRVALEHPEAFSGEKNTELVMKLMKIVFNTLGDPSQFSSPHAFLPGVCIQHLSVLASQAARKAELALNTKDQCRTLVSKAMTAVGQVNVYQHFFEMCIIAH